MNLANNKPTIPKKIILIFSGVVFCLILLELGLRLGGIIFASLQEHSNRISLFKKGSYRIMCLGESTTARQYPPFLEESLNQRNIGIKFSVIDKGINGINTIGILSYLEENLDTYKPDMVVTMMGNNDRQITYYKDIPEANSGVFRHCSAYRFIRLICMHIVHKLKGEDIYGLEKAGSKRNATLKERPTVAEKNSFSNEESLKQAIALNPRNDWAYIGLGWLYRQQGKFSEAEESFKQAIALNPKDDWRKDWGYRALGSLYSQMNKTGLAEEYSKKGTYAYSRLTIDNYHRLKAILDKRGIRLVCAQYPTRSVEPLKRIFAGERGVIFVDNERVFKEAVTQANYREYFRDMFAGDFGHCTRKGNELLAENIANVILKEAFRK